MKTVAHVSGWVLTPSITFALFLASSCANTSGLGRVCAIDEECASGVCLPNGLCSNTEDLSRADAGTEESTSELAAPPTAEVGDIVDGSDAGSSEAGFDTPPEGDISRHGCVPNHDGIITAEESPFGAGHTAMFRVTTGVTGFDSAPVCDGDECAWDFVHVSGATTDLVVNTEPLDNWWFAFDPAFSDATYVAPVGEFDLSFGSLEVCNQDQYGVFQVTDSALLMLGLVSEHEDEGTKLIYDPPLPILQFPLVEGVSWIVETTASGQMCNSWIDYNIRQTAESNVDAAGVVRTPFGDFSEVLRVNTLLQRHMGVGVMPTQIRTQTYVTECFTSIAAVVSEEGETDADFDRVAEVRRLAPLP